MHFSALIGLLKNTCVYAILRKLTIPKCKYIVNVKTFKVSHKKDFNEVRLKA